MGPLILPAVVWGLLGCGLRHVPHYEPVTWEVQPYGMAAWQVEDAVRRDLRRGRLDSLTIDGARVTEDALDEVDAEVLDALYGLTQRWARHAELDLWVPYPGADDGARPMTVVFDRHLNAEVTLGPRGGRPLLPPTQDARFEDGTASWTDEELAVASVAVAAIEAEAWPFLEGLTLRRQHHSPRAAHRELAWFDPTTEPPVIEVYDLCFAPTSGFVGPVDAPLPAAAMTLVHELGHAIADYPLRQAWVRYEAARRQAEPDEVRRARARWIQLGRRGPVIDAWAAVRDGPGPAPYGARSVHESFAEAYALHRLDPAALARALPDAATWFAEGGHLAAVDDAR